jgi:hypothetical protein
MMFHLVFQSARHRNDFRHWRSFAFAAFSARLLPLRHHKAWIVLLLGLRTLAQAAFKTDSG